MVDRAEPDRRTTGDPLVDLAQQAFPCAQVLVDEPEIDAGLVGDLAQRDLTRAAVGDQPLRGVQQRFANRRTAMRALFGMGRPSLASGVVLGLLSLLVT